MNRLSFVDSSEAARMLRIHPKTLLKWARQGRIEYVRLSIRKIVFTYEAIDKLVESATIKPKSGTEKTRKGNVPTAIPKRGGEKGRGESWQALKKEIPSWE